MSETVVKRVSVTFDDGLPLGTRGVFTHDGEKWIAHPYTKYSDVLAVNDRLIATLARARNQLTQWVAAHPEDAARTMMILATLAAADTDELVRDKIRAQTS